MTISAALSASAALLIVGWKPWTSGAKPVMTLARNAFGSGPVVHVLARRDTSLHPVAGDDGIEIWYRGSQRTSHIVVRRAGKVVLDTFQDSVEPPYVAPIPSVPGTLWEFVTAYRSDLASGLFRVVDEKPVAGRNLVWIGSDTVEIGVDPVSYRPRWIRDPSPLDSGFIQLVTAATIPYDPADFLATKTRM